MTNKNPFGPEMITIQRHTAWSLQASNGEYYKTNAPLTLEQFVDGKSYTVSGLVSAKGAKYINQIHDAAKTSNAPLPPPVATPNPPVVTKHRAGDDKMLSKKSEGRDFVKEAKGKTFSLIVAALAHNPDSSPVEILTFADQLLHGIEERGYF